MNYTGMFAVQAAGLLNQTKIPSQGLRFGKKNPDEGQKKPDYDEGDFFKLVGQPENQDLIDLSNQIIMEHLCLTTPMPLTIKPPYSFPVQEYRYFVTTDEALIRIDRKTLNVFEPGTTVEDVEAGRVSPKQVYPWANAVTIKFTEQGKKYGGKFAFDPENAVIEYTYKTLPESA